MMELATKVQGVVRIWALLGSGFLATACVGMGGARIPLAHDQLPAVSAPPPAEVFLNHRADDQRPKKVRIGRATFTLFAITSGSIVTEDELDVMVVNEVKSVLERSGIAVEMVNLDRVGTLDGPLLRVTVQSAKFTNYNWLFPLVPTWGGFQLGLSLEDAKGVSLFRRTFDGRGNSFQLTGHGAFSEAAREAMTEILEQMQTVFVSREFRGHLKPRASQATTHGAELETPDVSAQPPSSGTGDVAAPPPSGTDSSGSDEVDTEPREPRTAADPQASGLGPGSEVRQDAAQAESEG